MQEPLRRVLDAFGIERRQNLTRITGIKSCDDVMAKRIHQIDEYSENLAVEIPVDYTQTSTG